MKIASWRRRKAAAGQRRRRRPSEKEAVPNDMSSMIMQATELVTVEADDGNDATTAALGDMEITLRAMKPSPVVTTPSQQTDMHGRDGSNAVVQTPTRDYVDVDSSPTDAGVVEQGELKTDESEKMAAAADGGQEVAIAPGVGQEEELKAESSSSEKNILPAQRSPTSQFELDVLNATYPTVDFENLQKCSRALLDDDDDKSISSEESQGSDDDSILSDAASVNAKVQKDDEVLDFVHDILSPMDCAADYMFCQMQCAFPNIVEDANEIMTTNLHHLMFCGEGEEEAKEEEGGAVVVESDGAGDDNRGEGDNDQGGEDEKDVVVVFGTSPDEQGEGGAGQDNETADEQEEDEGGEEIVVDEQQDSLEVDVVLGRWVKMQEDQLEIASYSPGEGFVLRKDGKLPELSEDEVLIRVDATVISTRDCLERIRRDTTEDLKDDVWVPGHEIVGSVVRAGAAMEAKSLMDKRIAAVLPYGGGCSQYVSIHANDVIVLPDEADSNEVVALLSTYMTAYQCLESVADIEEAKEEEGEEEAKVGEADAEAEAISSNKDDAEQKKSHLFGKNVLIIDSGSPVGQALINLATNAGATVHTVSHLISHFNAIRWRGAMDLIIDVVGDSDNNPSYYKIMKTRGRLVRVNTTSCEKRYVPHAVAGKIEGGKDTSYYGRVINDKAIDYNVFHSFNDDKEEFAEDLAYLHDLRQIGKIEPKLFSQVGFDGLGEGWEKLMAEGGNGIVVVSPWKLGFTTVHG
mmetsp:Transcript_18362/g.27887  ORF Transcript_18362/g.27887 Transcript_18362/m.27887 type:complete len:746 (+) Transcript_18362:10-2247(+)